MHEMLTREVTKNKYIFWDIDGVLAPYRFNGHLADPNGTDNGALVEEIENGVYLKRPPSKFMQHIVETCESKENIILSLCRNEKERADKEKWLDEHYPNIKIRFIISQQAKHDIILNYCKENNLSLETVFFIDDNHVLLREAERKGITSYHISSFLDWDYQ